MKDKIKGRVWKFGDDVTTDEIIPSRYLFQGFSDDDLGEHAMEAINSEFSSKIIPGDIIVAGKNFGCGSSREEAPLALKKAQIGAVVATSFARLFYRNAINIALPVVICMDELLNVKNGEEIEIDFNNKIIKKGDTQEEIPVQPPIGFLKTVIENDGLLNLLKKDINS